ncbi:MAG: hypothetical protein CVU84_14320 [Firmicutes bacterium HGW-Firmicutes-1]|jgi:signal transduction histidine kinase|nr:MAG: hypothetical protein CVU84_14320 [Firmicutes bacterium HGW-Firmicutes-1]
MLSRLSWIRFSTDFDLSQTVEIILLTMEVIAYKKNLQLDYIVEPGLRINGNKEQIAQGLDLSIAKEIVEQHGGNISVAGSIGQSTTFKVKLTCIS